MTSQDLILALVRTTLCTSLAAGVAWFLLARFHLASPLVHRVAWLLVVAQGWLIFPWTFEIETPPAPVADIVVQLDAISTPPVSQVVTPAVAPSRDVQSQAGILKLLTRSIVFAWILGAAAVAIPFAWRYARFAHRLPREVVPPLSPWQVEWEDQLQRAHVRQSVDLRATRDLGPLLCWVPFRYLVLVPQSLWQLLTRAEREAIVRHELAHLSRGDLWKSLLIRILALPQWFNPLAWRAVRAFDEAGEWACDDLVRGTNRADELVLARSLVRTGEYPTTPLPATMGASGGMLSRRIRRLVAPDFKEESKMKKTLVIGSLAALAAVQLVRIERVVAEDAGETTATPGAEAASSETPNGVGTKKPLTIAEWMSQPRAEMADNSKPAQSVSEWMSRQSDKSATRPEILNWADREHYVIEPPDIVLIKTTKLVPSATIKVAPFDALLVEVGNALVDQPIRDAFAIDEEGQLDLGPTYGRVDVAGLTIDEATSAISNHLESKIEKPEVSVSWAMCSATPEIGGQGLVGVDGRIDLGEYGKVYIAGMTCEEVERTIVARLIQSLSFDEVELRIDVQQNSKVVYLITKNPETGDHVVRIPCTPTLSISDLLQQTAPHAVDLAAATITLRHSATNGIGEEVVRAVVWDANTNRPTEETDYHLLPGDRIFVTIKVSRGDALLVVVDNAPLANPICNAFVVDASGSIHLGPNYGRVRVAGLTIDGVVSAIQHKLSFVIDEPKVSVAWGVCNTAPNVPEIVLAGPTDET